MFCNLSCLSLSPHHLQGESLFQYHQSGPASPVSSQGPDRLPCPGNSLHHPGHLPALHWSAQQEAQTLSGAKKFQRQLQHPGEHAMKRCNVPTVKNVCTLSRAAAIPWETQYEKPRGKFCCLNASLS